MKSLVISSQTEWRERGLRMLEELSSISPDDPDLLSVRAGVLLERNTPESVEDAIAILERIIRLDPRNIAAQHHLIRLTRERGELLDAVDLVTRAVGANPENLSLQMVQAELEIERGNTGIGRRLALSALEVDPDSAAAHDGLGRIAHQMADYRAAVRHFEAALQAQASATSVHYRLAMAYRGLGEGERMRSHLERRGEGAMGFPDPVLAATS